MNVLYLIKCNINIVYVDQQARECVFIKSKKNRSLYLVNLFLFENIYHVYCKVFDTFVPVTLDECIVCIGY